MLTRTRSATAAPPCCLVRPHLDGVSSTLSRCAGAAARPAQRSICACEHTRAPAARPPPPPKPPPAPPPAPLSQLRCRSRNPGACFLTRRRALCARRQLTACHVFGIGRQQEGRLRWHRSSIPPSCAPLALAAMFQPGPPGFPAGAPEWLQQPPGVAPTQQGMMMPPQMQGGGFQAGPPLGFVSAPPSSGGTPVVRCACVCVCVCAVCVCTPLARPLRVSVAANTRQSATPNTHARRLRAACSQVHSRHLWLGNLTGAVRAFVASRAAHAHALTRRGLGVHRCAAAGGRG
jgi:hypothetical protein